MTILTSFSSSAASKTILYPFASTAYEEHASYIAILKVESLGEMHYSACTMIEHSTYSYIYIAQYI